MKTAAEIRNGFLKYFESKGHTVVESASLIPQNDPTLLFTNAGMVQFKGVFLGEEKRPYSRATSSQKCVRAGGKHNDLENVGRTARHHTFFEMLGNFSFGDYFKQDAIKMGWEFLTGVLKIDPSRLWVTVFLDDKEAYDIWKDQVEVSPDRIVKLGEKDNFWSMGETGPCGPCSEILIDQGEEFKCSSPDCKVGCDCDRYLELWNLVFMQYDRDINGNKTVLPKPSIDTGMGLERVAAVLQNKKSNYDSDLFEPLIRFVEKISGIKYGFDPEHDTSIRVIADHCRATSFLIADGVLPSNEGRGYVLRRIMRRAARRGKLLGLEKPFLHDAVDVLAEQMKEVYPELNRSLDYIKKVVFNEEKAFSLTLKAGLEILEQEVKKIKKKNKTVINGDIVFKLYDTYGFPVDLTSDIVREHDIEVDSAGFEKAMEQQKKRARQAWKGSGDDKVAGIYNDIVQEGVRVKFTGYDEIESSSKILKIIVDGSVVDEASSGAEVEIITQTTPFYGESGGQVGDRGVITGNGYKIMVSDTLKPVPGLTVHRGKIEEGKVRQGDTAILNVNASRRSAISNNHTATHILQSSLRKILGNHVKQSGSLVTPDRLRFDFTHFEAIKKDDLRKVEALVNEHIRKNILLEVKVLPAKEAMEIGATALFGEKYGDKVRVVDIRDYSMELCGGNHVSSTGEIGLFKIVSEGAVAAGVRRIEAVSGDAACEFVRKEEDIISRLSDILKTEPRMLVERVERIMSDSRNMEKEIEKFKGQLISKQADSVLDNIRKIGDYSVISTRIDPVNPKAMREYGDKLRDRIDMNSVILLGTEFEGKAHLLAMVKKDKKDKVSAGTIIKEIAPVVGGRGGGRPDMAQAGGSKPGKIEEAIDKACELIEKLSREEG
jgi:alanyl-tRNA synthetase